jgi:hypothetical protein
MNGLESSVIVEPRARGRAALALLSSTCRAVSIARVLRVDAARRTVEAPPVLARGVAVGGRFVL